MLEELTSEGWGGVGTGAEREMAGVHVLGSRAGRPNTGSSKGGVMGMGGASLTLERGPE